MKCRGRDENASEVLETPVDIKLVVTQHTDTVFSTQVECPYSFGGHGGNCNAAHPGTFEGRNVCPYRLDIPYGEDSRIKRGKGLAY